MLFVYERFNKNFDEILKEENSMRIELMIYEKIRNKSYEDMKHITFTRLLYLPVNAQFSLIHLKIYEMFRVYLRNFIECNKEQSPIDISINHEDISPETIFKE